MVIKTRMPGLRNEFDILLEYLGNMDVFRDKGQNMGKWEKLSHVITVYGATSCAHPRSGPWL